jgi:thymidylate synthase
MSLEHAYLHLLEQCLNNPVRETRNAHCHSLFGAFLEHDLSDGFPLLTTKKVFFRGVLEELAWFLRGSTNNQELIDKGVHIWDKNAEQYDPVTKVECGAIYGFNWRHFGAKYVDCHTDYTDQGVDQIAPACFVCLESRSTCMPSPMSCTVPVLCPRRQAFRSDVSTQLRSLSRLAL